MGKWEDVWKRFVKRIANHNPYAEDYLREDTLLENFYKTKWESEKELFLKAHEAKNAALIRVRDMANMTLSRTTSDLEASEAANKEAQDALSRVSSVSRESELRDPVLAAKMNTIRVEASAKQLIEDRMRIAVEDARRAVQNADFAIGKHAQALQDANEVTENYKKSKNEALKAFEENSRKAEQVLGRNFEVREHNTNQFAKDVLTMSPQPGALLKFKPSNANNWFSPIQAWATGVDNTASAVLKAQTEWKQGMERLQNSMNQKPNSQVQNSDRPRLGSFVGLGNNNLKAPPNQLWQDWNTNGMDPWMSFTARSQYQQPQQQQPQQPSLPQMLFPQVQQPYAQTGMFMPQMPQMQQPQMQQPQMQQMWSAPMMLSQLQATANPSANNEGNNPKLLQDAISMFSAIESLRSESNPITTQPEQVSQPKMGGSRPLAPFPFFGAANAKTGVTLRLRMIFTLMDSMVSLLAAFVSPPWLMVWLAAYMMSESNR